MIGCRDEESHDESQSTFSLSRNLTIDYETRKYFSKMNFTTEVCNIQEALEIPIINDLTMILGSISQSKATGVVVDFTDPSTVYDNVKLFGMTSVVSVPRIKLDTVTALSAFCEKASMGCLVAPTLSAASVLLQQAAISASFHYSNVEIVESRPDASDLPSPDAIQIANNLSNLGQIYNREDLSTNVLARGEALGEDGVRVHTWPMLGPSRVPSSTTVHFSGPGEVYSIKHEITDVQTYMLQTCPSYKLLAELDVRLGEVFVETQLVLSSSIE
ncbi:dihydrodipicolinate reductase-like protein CRR1, chloroplastic [Tasmannia lanceolata]|uniref:dihydrodipicolinate reductase-like protein CRR1, chloroplastic n=1 Tax=Tasmannia lanceolata TaxID=3420 RepID=UPI004062FB99